MRPLPQEQALELMPASSGRVDCLSPHPP